ncbi:MAG: hypothetical protein E6R11_06055 [Rhodocyclaceae bacterium]|mgnify:CR=1 FL=1|nr:MAG: hypothetical protein E6R11_06055 [Rhodocyclaceae bacterium]
MNVDLPPRRLRPLPCAIGDQHTVDTARELVSLYHALRRAPGVPAHELDAAREAAARWCRRAGIRFDPDEEASDENLPR